MLLVDSLSALLNLQFDTLVDIKLFELEFQDEENTEIDDLELAVLQTDELFDRLTDIDSEIEEVKANLELICRC